MFSLSFIRQANLFVRLMSSTIILTFMTLVLSPTVMAAKADLQNQASKQDNPTNLSEQSQLSQLVVKAKGLYQELQQQLSNNQETSDNLNQLSALYNQALNLDETVSAQYEQEKQWLEDKSLSLKLKKRQQKHWQHHRREMDSFLQNLEKVLAAKNENQLIKKIERALKQLDKKAKRTHQKFNPDNLPFKKSKPKKDNKPKTKKEHFIDAGFYDNPRPMYAALGDFKYDRLAGASDPAYLAETDEIVLTQAIKNKAQELSYSPVKIFNYVYNHIEWTPIWGGSQDAALTLEVKRGSAMDISSLLIALLRASKFPARYVHGSIELPLERFSNWVGNFDNIQDAVDFAASGGIPITLVTKNGVLSSVKMEHVWVETAIDFLPSRGVINRHADRWGALDPSFKKHSYQTGLDINQITQLDTQAMYQELADSGTNNESEGWLTGLNADNFKQTLLNAQSLLTDYIGANLTNPMEKELIGGKTIKPFNFRTFPSSLSNKIVVAGARYAELPDNLRYKVTIKLFNSQLDRSLLSPSLSTTLSMAQISKKRLGITYEAGTEEDANLVSDLIASGTKELPLYLIQKKPVIKLDNEVIKTGIARDMGADQPMDIVISSPQGNKTMSFSPVVGDEMVVSVNTGNISQDWINQRVTTMGEGSSADDLYLIGLGFWIEADMVARLVAKAQGVNVMRMPSLGVISIPLMVKYSFGIPNKGYYIARNIDIKHNELAVSGASMAIKRQYMATTGSMQSYLEGSILEQMVHNWQGTGHSAMQVMMDANQQNIKIYTINNTNASQILPQLQLPAEVMSDINNALNAGYEVTTPERVPDKGVGTKGAGYIITDTVTGAASYRISNGLDGGEGQGPCAEPEPEPMSIGQALFYTLMTIIVLAIVASLIASSGGTAAPVLAQVMATMGLSFLAFPATAGALCTPIEKTRDNTSPLNIKHNQCANSRSGNLFPNMDVCIEAPGIGARKFDAYNGSVLWEVKTYNFANQSFPGAFARFILPKDINQAKTESNIAHACGFSYWYAVGDILHHPAIEALEPGFYPTVVDYVEIDSENCLRPSTK